MSVLNDMTKASMGIMQAKAAKASKLTPVAGESSMSVAQAALGIPEIPQVFLTNEAVRDVAVSLRAKAALLIEVADGLDLLTLMPTDRSANADRSTKVEQAKVAERAADERAATVLSPEAARFAANMKRLSAEAQAAAFTAVDDGADPEPVAPQPVVADGWNCPDHGGASLIDTVSRKGRAYRMCGVDGCERFEK